MPAFLEQIDLNILVPLLITTVVAIVGWYVVHHFTAARELRNKRLELRTQYLLQAYRKLERTVDHTVNQTLVDDLESTLADLQLLGDEKQIEATVAYIKQIGGKHLSKLPLGPILEELRNSLRKELGLPPVHGTIEHLRLTVTPSKVLPDAER